MLLILLGIHLLLTAAIVFVGIYGMTSDLRENYYLLNRRIAKLERRMEIETEYSPHNI